MKERIKTKKTKKWLKYILCFILGLFGAGIAFSGILGVFENLLGQINLTDLIGDILTIAIGLYLLVKSIKSLQ